MDTRLYAIEVALEAIPQLNQSSAATIDTKLATLDTKFAMTWEQFHREQAFHTGVGSSSDPTRRATNPRSPPPSTPMMVISASSRPLATHSVTFRAGVSLLAPSGSKV